MFDGPKVYGEPRVYGEPVERSVMLCGCRRCGCPRAAFRDDGSLELSDKGQSVVLTREELDELLEQIQTWRNG